jgi:cobalt-zinc-cadmium efflux system outer membrane protein
MFIASVCYRRMLVSIFLATLCLSNNVAAQPSLSLDDAIQKTMVLNPSLQVFKYQNQSLKGSSATAALRPSYEVGVELENFSGSGPFSGVDNAELTVSLSSVVEMGGKRLARLNVVSDKLTYLESQRQVQSLELMGEVTRRYVDVLEAQQRVTLSTKASQLAHDTLREVKKRVTAGAVPKAELKRAEAAAAQARIASSAEQQRLNIAKVTLSAMWGELTPDFGMAQGNLYEFGESVSYQTLLAGVEQNPAITIYASAERVKAAELRIAQTQSQADIRWSVGLKRLQVTDDTAVTAGFSMPLFAENRNSGAIASALAAQNEVALQKEQALLRMHSQLYRAYSSHEQAVTTVTNYQNHIIPTLQDALKETREAYLFGRYSYLEYVNARQELLNAQATLISNAAAALRFGAEIEQLTAEPLSQSSIRSTGAMK